MACYQWRLTIYLTWLKSIKLNNWLSHCWAISMFYNRKIVIILISVWWFCYTWEYIVIHNGMQGLHTYELLCTYAQISPPPLLKQVQNRPALSYMRHYFISDRFGDSGREWTFNATLSLWIVLPRDIFTLVKYPVLRTHVISIRFQLHSKHGSCGFILTTQY